MSKNDKVVEPDFTKEEFIIPASDNQGNNVNFRVRIQPGHSRQIEIIRASGKFPFKTGSDVARWCIHVGLKRLLKMGKVKSVMGQVEAINNALREEEAEEAFLSIFERMEEVIYKNQKTGSMGHAVKLIMQLKREIEGMPDGHWKEQYQKAWLEKFGKYVSKAAKASFSEFSEE